MTRGYIGVEAQEMTPAPPRRAMHLTDNAGALLAGVLPDSPAAQPGLQPGDVIESVNGKKITNPRELAVNVAAIQPGDEAHLTVLHDGQTKDVTVKVGQLPNEQTASNDNQGERAPGPDRTGAGAAVTGYAQPARRAGRDEGRGGAAACSPVRRPSGRPAAG